GGSRSDRVLHRAVEKQRQLKRFGPLKPGHQWPPERRPLKNRAQDACLTLALAVIHGCTIPASPKVPIRRIVIMVSLFPMCGATSLAAAATKAIRLGRLARW